MDVLEAIQTRRSIRKFKDAEVADALIDQFLAAATMAPYGHNQVWRFAIIKDKQLKAQIAELTHYAAIVNNAPVIVPVFFDRRRGYHRIKDAQTMGACIQNMLLAIHGLGLASVWIGEILKNGAAVGKLCRAPDDYELSAVIALGYGSEAGVLLHRKPLDRVVFFRG